MLKNILVVSYDVNLNDLIADILKGYDYNVNFTDYDKSAEMMKNIKYYSILLDIDIIDHSGIETLINIYSYARFTPIIVLLNKDDNDTRINLIKYGADDFILKPFNPLELKLRIKKALK